MLDAPQSSLALAALTPLAAELCTLKRVRDARAPESLAARLFRRAWAALLAGQDAESCALQTTADALAACRLGGIDRAALAACGIESEAAATILARSFDEVAIPLDPALGRALRAQIGQDVPSGTAPAFAEALIRQPRAGATCPGKPRIILEPPESHGEHCLVVAVLGTLIAPRYGAALTIPFLAGLAHHLHNATLPDSGFAGEVLLGAEFDSMMRRLFAQALAALPASLAAATRAALGHIQDAATPEGQAFHAADVIDRVLEMCHFAAVARFTVDQALDDMDLVHAGPVQRFHHAVLAEAGLP